MTTLKPFLLTALLLGSLSAPALAAAAADSAPPSAPAAENVVLDTPRAVAVDKDGNVFIADYGASTIYKLTPAGKLTRYAGQPSTSGNADGPALKASFLNPSGIAVDQKGNVYVADSDNNLIRKISADGVVSTLASTSGNKTSAGMPQLIFNGPTGVAVDKDGNVFVADDHNAAVRKITLDGTVTTVAGKLGEAGYKDGPAADARFDSPRGITLDSAGNLYVADEALSNIRKITPAGNVTTLAGKPQATGDKDGPGNEATFGGPRGLAVDKDGNIFVADTDNSTVRKVTPAGAVSTYAGKPGAASSGDGKAADARFAGLRGIAVDAAGNVYIADTDNGCVRKITPNGTVSTIAGKPPGA